MYVCVHVMCTDSHVLTGRQWGGASRAEGARTNPRCITVGPRKKRWVSVPRPWNTPASYAYTRELERCSVRDARARIGPRRPVSVYLDGNVAGADDGDALRLRLKVEEIVRVDGELTARDAQLGWHATDCDAHSGGVQNLSLATLRGHDTHRVRTVEAGSADDDVDARLGPVDFVVLVEIGHVCVTSSLEVSPVHRAS